MVGCSHGPEAAVDLKKSFVATARAGIKRNWVTGVLREAEGRSDWCMLQREASGLALHPRVKGYCRPDLPAHYREKIGFVLRRMATDRRQKACFSSQSAGLLGLAGGTSGRIFFEGVKRGDGEAGSLPQERFLAANKI